MKSRLVAGTALALLTATALVLTDDDGDTTAVISPEILSGHITATPDTSEPDLADIDEILDDSQPPPRHRPTPTSSTTSSTIATSTTAPPVSATTTVAPTTTTTSAPSGSFSSGHEASFASMINSHRADDGLAPLARHSGLDAEARAWTQQMAAQGGISHSDIGRFLPPWTSVGENVGVGGSVTSIFGGLAASAGHNANMLGDFTHMGIGAWVDSAGTIWTTHIFTK